MKLLVLICTAVYLMVACKKSVTNTPACIVAKIETFKDECCASSATVKKYRFQGGNVYVFDQGNCGADFTSEVIDENCNILGYLGGFIGNTKIKNEEFSHAIMLKEVWNN
jgi:hypothetical protein